MLIQGTLRIKEEAGREVSMVDEPHKNREVCWV
jgi:hypothetical protein